MNKGFLDKHFWPIAIVLGLLISFFVGFASFQSIYSETSERFLNTVEYVKKQSLTYDSFNDASATKSLLRTIENASQLARDIENDKGVTSEENLSKHVSDLRSTAAIVLDEKGNLITEYSIDNIGYEELKSVICDTPSLDVVTYPAKVYTVRVNLEDGSYADVGCAARLDKPGVVVSVYHTGLEFANRYALTLQSLLDGYEGVNSGSIVIEEEGKVIASNTVDEYTSGTIELSEHDQNIVQSIKDCCEPNVLGVVNDGSGAYYFGTYGKARDYYVYTYTDARKLFHRVGSSVIITALVYGALVIVYLMFRRRSQNRYLNELVEKERHYNAELKKLAQKAQTTQKPNSFSE